MMAFIFMALELDRMDNEGHKGCLLRGGHSALILIEVGLLDYDLIQELDCRRDFQTRCTCFHHLERPRIEWVHSRAKWLIKAIDPR